MSRFCQNCGKELRPDQDVCLGCGIYINKQPAKIKKKFNYSLYFVSTGIAMNILAFCFLGAYIEGGSVSYIGIGAPSICTLIGSLIQLAGSKNKIAVSIASLFYIIGAVSNLVGIEDISLFFILAIITSGLGFVFAYNMD